jgi:succinyl-CoA synthetase beta subunit
MPDIKAYEMLKRYKIPFARFQYIKYSKPEAMIKQIKHDLPMVLKIDGDIIHKKKLGCVEIVECVDAGAKARLILKNAKKTKKRIHGMIVQDFVKGDEVIIGAKRDPSFGIVVMFGSGGIMANVIKDVSLRVVPFDEQDAEIMIKETKAYQVLIEHKQEDAMDKLIDIILKVAKLVEDNPRVKELDINPVFLPKCVAGDVRIILN